MLSSVAFGSEKNDWTGSHTFAENIDKELETHNLDTSRNGERYSTKGYDLGIA
jgi:hypothetical protein